MKTEYTAFLECREHGSGRQEHYVTVISSSGSEFYQDERFDRGQLVVPSPTGMDAFQDGPLGRNVRQAGIAMAGITVRKHSERAEELGFPHRRMTLEFGFTPPEAVRLPDDVEDGDKLISTHPLDYRHQEHFLLAAELEADARALPYRIKRANESG